MAMKKKVIFGTVVLLLAVLGFALDAGIIATIDRGNVCFRPKADMSGSAVDAGKIGSIDRSYSKNSSPRWNR
jgi:hypothetical protein